MRFSIVTPSFNQGTYLEQALRSVLEQGVDVELIVIDGGSTDASKGIIEAYADQLGYWCCGPDGGQTDALNKGVARASGDIVGWINSDDYFLPGALRAVARRFEARDHPDIVFGYTVIVDAEGQPIREYRHDEFSVESVLNLGTDITQQAFFWRREAADGVFPLPVELRFCMDLELFLRFGALGRRFARLPRFLGAFRLHGNAKSATIADLGRHEHVEVVERYRAMLAVPRQPRWIPAAKRRLRMLARGDAAYALLGGRIGMSRQARRLAREAFAVPTGRLAGVRAGPETGAE